MPSGLTKTKRRIASISSTQKITKAMEMVATVKLKRFRTSFEQGELYRKELAHILGEAFFRDEESMSHYAAENQQAEGKLVILITSNLWLCAGYNNNLYSYVKEVFDPSKDTLAIIGQKGIAHFEREGNIPHLLQDFAGLDLSLDSRLIRHAVDAVKTEFNSGKYRRIEVVYTRYVNSLKFLPATATLLPVEIPLAPDPSEEYCPPLFEPSPRVMIHDLLSLYLATEIRGFLIESQLSEQASRRSAMESANDNADELLAKLRIEYNKARQAAITQEITEVVNGASAQ